MKEFKTTLYIFFSILGIIIVSCAEEGPYKLGILESKISVSTVTPTTAVINVTFPQNNENLLSGTYASAYLIPESISEIGEGWNSKAIEAYDYKRDGKSKLSYFFEKLNSNTEYSLILYPEIDYDNSNGGNNIYYNPGFSFYTSNEGDYSILGEVTCDVVEALPGYTRIKLTLPSELKFESHDCTIEASTSSDMSDVVECAQLRMLDATPISNGKEAECVFTELTNGKYFLHLHGSFRWLGQFDITFSDITLDIPKPIDLTNVSNLNLQCDVDFVGENFSIFRMTLPQNMNQSWSESHWDKNKLTWSCGNIVNSEDLKYNDSGSYRYIYIPKTFEDGDEISFRLSGVFEYYINDYGSYDKYLEFDSNVKFNSEDTLVPRPSFKTLFSGTDYAIISMIYPNEITGVNSNELKYYVSDNNTWSDSYEGVSSLTNYSILIFNTSQNYSSERFFRVEGDFYFQGIKINDGIINIKGALKPVENNRKFYDISSQMDNEDLKISISCPDNFHFEYYYDVKLDCRLSSENEDLVFSGISYSYNSSSKTTIVFYIKKDKFEKLRKGEKYIVTISGYNLLYGSEYINSSSDSYNLNWVYQ